jgi:hypothetical protein
VRTLERALAVFAELGLDPPEAVRTDKAMVSRKTRRFHALLAHHRIRPIRTPAYTPRCNGKGERLTRRCSKSGLAAAPGRPPATAPARS